MKALDLILDREIQPILSRELNELAFILLSDGNACASLLELDHFTYSELRGCRIEF